MERLRRLLRLLRRERCIVCRQPVDHCPRSRWVRERCTCTLDGFAGAEVDPLCPQHARPGDTVIYGSARR